MKTRKGSIVGDKPNEDDKLIIVEMPLGEYKIMRKLIKDYAAVGRFWSIMKMFTFFVVGVLAAWLSFGEKVIAFIKAWR